MYEGVFLDWLVGAASACAVALLAIGAATDIESRRIPNGVSASVALCGAAGLLGLSPADAFLTVVLASTAFACSLMLFMRGQLGGGDVKLLSATMLWVQPSLFSVFAVTFGLASILVTAALVVRRRFAGGDVEALRSSVPLAVPIACAGVVTILDRLAIWQWS